MKALVISDRQEIIESVTPVLKQNGFDIIHYRWIIKALDNVEEIQPDVIVLSAAEYPRHWKTLSGFVKSGIGGNSVKLYLNDLKELNAEDSKKAGDLGVEDFADAFLSKYIAVKVILNTEGNSFVYADGQYYPSENYTQIKASDETSVFTEGSFVKYVTISDGEKTSSFSAKAEKSKYDSEEIGLRIEKYYEKEI